MILGFARRTNTYTYDQTMWFWRALQKFENDKRFLRKLLIADRNEGKKENLFLKALISSNGRTEFQNFHERAIYSESRNPKVNPQNCFSFELLQDFFSIDFVLIYSDVIFNILDAIEQNFSKYLASEVMFSSLKIFIENKHYKDNANVGIFFEKLKEKEILNEEVLKCVVGYIPFDDTEWWTNTIENIDVLDKDEINRVLLSIQRNVKLLTIKNQSEDSKVSMENFSYTTESDERIFQLKEEIDFWKSLKVNLILLFSAIIFEIDFDNSNLTETILILNNADSDIEAFVTECLKFFVESYLSVNNLKDDEKENLILGKKCENVRMFKILFKFFKKALNQINLRIIFETFVNSSFDLIFTDGVHIFTPWVLSNMKKLSDSATQKSLSAKYFKGLLLETHQFWYKSFSYFNLKEFNIYFRSLVSSDDIQEIIQTNDDPSGWNILQLSMLKSFKNFKVLSKLLLDKTEVRNSLLLSNSKKEGLTIFMQFFIDHENKFDSFFKFSTEYLNKNEIETIFNKPYSRSSLMTKFILSNYKSENKLLSKIIKQLT